MDRLKSINALRSYSVDIAFEGELRKAALSVLLQIFKKLGQMEMNRLMKPPKKKKEFNISMEPYEAWFLEQHIRGIKAKGLYNGLGCGTIADQINQKLA